METKHMILVIGGTGKVGSEVVKLLVQKRLSARVLVRSARRAGEIKTLGLDPIDGDVTNIHSVEVALKGVEKVFLLTPPSENEAQLKRAIIDAAKKAHVKHLVLQSGAGAEFKSPISQARQHAESEAYLKASGLAYTILQPYFFMQNFLGQAATIKGISVGGVKSAGAIYGNFKQGKVAMVDTRDIAAVAVACLTKSLNEGRTHVITGGAAITHAEAADKFSSALGKKIDYLDVPTEQVIKATISMGTPEWLAADLGKLGELISAGFFAPVTNVVETIAQKQPVTFEQFVADNVATFS